MALVPYSVTALAESDAEGTSGKNIIAGAIVEFYDAETGGSAQTLYDDAASANPSTTKATDAQGQVTVFVEQGLWWMTINGGTRRAVTIDNSASVVAAIAGQAIAPSTITTTGDATFSGNVGIGTAPSALTDISGVGTGGRGLRVTETSTSKSTGVYTLEVDSSAHTSNTTAAGAMKVSVNSGDAMVINGLGNATFHGNVAMNGGTVDSNVGLIVNGEGTTSSTYSFIARNSLSAAALEINDAKDSRFYGNVGIGTAANSAFKTIIYETTTSNPAIRVEKTTTANTSQIVFNNPNGLVGSITTSGTATAYNTSSDPRLKTFFIEDLLDSEINTKFNELYSTFRRFTWKNDPDGEVVWGFDAHACIDAGLDMGTEGTGPRDLAIGDVYEIEEIPEVTEEVTEEVQVTVTKTRETTSIEVIDGVPTQVTKTEEYDEPVFEDITVVDVDGNPVTQMVESGEFNSVVIGQDEEGNDITEEQPIMVEQAVTHSMPVMETITKTVVVQEAKTNEKIVTSAGVDQSKAVPILLAKIEQLERRLQALEA